MKDPFEQFHQFIEALLAGRKPKRFRVETQEDLEALKVAARLAAARTPSPEEPEARFLAALQQKLMKQVRGGKETARDRRRLFAAALTGLAAGLSSGIGLDRLLFQPARQQPSTPPRIPLVRDNGRWFLVAKLSSLAENATIRFAAGALEGYLVKRGDQVSALSAICSHMPCSLLWQEREGHFLCPCHDAAFYPDGELKYARRPYPPLTRIEVKVADDDVLVWSIGEDLPRQGGTAL